MLEAEPISEAQAKFTAMSRVVSGMRAFDTKAADGSPFVNHLAGEIARRPFTSRRSIEKPAVKALRVAWQTELAARIGEQLDDPGLRLATLQTLPVQTYYAAYNAGRALTEVGGNSISKHAGLHHAYASEHYRRSAGVWAVRLTGDPDRVDTCILDPPICEPVAFNPMSIREDDAEYVWAALRMARRWRIERARTAWLSDRRNRTKQGKPYRKLPAEVKQALHESERPTSAMDFLYELRCSTNYRSIDEYAVDVSASLVNDFHGGLLHLMNSILLTYEAQVGLYVGGRVLQGHFEEWAGAVAGIGTWATEAGAARMTAIRGAGI